MRNTRAAVSQNGSLLIGMAVVTAVFFAPTIETRYFPAAAPAEITKTEQGDEGAIFWGASARLRPECSYDSLEWHLGKRDGQHVPVIVVVGPPQVRANGAFSFGPWSVLGISVGELLDDSFADVLHQCRIFADRSGQGGMPLPWLTRSRFWR